MTVHKLTIDTYNNSAGEFVQHFHAYVDQPLISSLAEAFKLAGSPPKARVVEIGCGTGRDAKEITKHAAWYEGFDPAEKLLEIARQRLPGVSFVKADALSYNYPGNLDAVFAVASMLHLNKKDFAATCRRVAHALRPGGVLLIRLKEAEAYAKDLQKDEFGERLFYFYSPALVSQLAGPVFEQVYESHDLAGPKQKRWFTVILRKKSA